MSKIRLDLNSTPFDGQAVTFKAPCDASEVTGLNIYYMVDNVEVCDEYSFTDANGNDVGNIDMLFSPNSIVKVILDTNTNRAFIQNADTNAYLEGRFADIEDKLQNVGGYETFTADTEPATRSKGKLYGLILADYRGVE